ncbi:hypothetical protein AB0J72_32940 [Dactylosporangium sp. NPDC049742]|uniref:hypothetical protein n=1 Tax=Dactylosporangium sp. NPDC049742 TaxID=3154737 RepID=UPI00341851C9
MHEVQVLTAGTMNRSWQITGAGGVAAVREVLDIDAAAARRQAAAGAANGTRVIIWRLPEHRRCGRT